MGVSSLVGYQLLKRSIKIKNPVQVKLILMGAFFCGQLGHILISWTHQETLYYALTTSILFMWGNTFLMIKFLNKVAFALFNLIVLIALLVLLDVKNISTIIYRTFIKRWISTDY